MPLLTKARDDEYEKIKKLSFAQTLLYCWCQMDGQVCNGGFVQFYYNGFGHYVPAIIQGLDIIGDKEMADLVRTADRFYHKENRFINRVWKSGIFGNDV
ncbi:MAG: DUF4375 domain-containing protein, partial [Chitinophagaceae bacterium]